MLEELGQSLVSMWGWQNWLPIMVGWWKWW